MAYLKPPFVVRSIFNRIVMGTGGFGTASLVVSGRRSGREQRIPVIPVVVDGSVYVVSSRGESEWVRNARATGRVELSGRTPHRGRYAAVEIPVDERTKIIEAYREAAGRTVAAYWKQLPEPADHPVFRLDPQ